MEKGILFLGMIGAMVSCGAIAQQDSSKFYVGAGFGIVTVPDVEGVSFSDANNGSIQFGYKISENFAIEAQYSKSTKDAAAENYSSDSIGIDFSGIAPSGIAVFSTYAADISSYANIETTALYAVYRSGGDLYFKLKGGYLSEKTDLTVTVNSLHLAVNPVSMEDGVAEKGTIITEENIEEFGADRKQTFSEKQSDFSAGIGAGYKITSNLFSELEYTMLDEDLDFYSVSINYAF